MPTERMTCRPFGFARRDNLYIDAVGTEWFAVRCLFAVAAGVTLAQCSRAVSPVHGAEVQSMIRDSELGAGAGGHELVLGDQCR
jgi:hypothetical protein